MKSLVSVSIGLALANLPAAAIAQVTQTYQYDGNGRLIGVTTTGSAGTNTATYAYDDAHNRTSRNQTGTTAYAAILSLPLDQALRPDQALVSPDGRFSLALRASGRLELWTDAQPYPMLVDAGAGAFNLTDSGQAHFIPQNVDSRTRGASVALADDGSLLVVDETGSTLWRSIAPLESEAGK